MPDQLHNQLVKALNDFTRSRPLIQFGFGALILGVIAEPLSYQFSAQIKETLHCSAVLLLFFALVMVLAAIKADTKS